MEKNVSKIGLINLLTLLFTGGCVTWMAFYSGSTTVFVSIAFITMGLIVGCVSCFQMRLESREWNEHLEVEGLKRDSENSTLFSTDTELYPARRAREQFDKYFVPLFTIILTVAQGTTAWFLWKWIDTADKLAPEKALLTIALLGVTGLLLFVIGRYSAGLSRIANQRLLQASASYLMLGSVLCMVGAIVHALIWLGYPFLDKIIGKILIVFLAVVALETLLSLIMEIYRPRVRGTGGRVLYESRLIGLLGQPDGLIRTAAEVLDYQFGFKVSETWVYRFLENALAWIVLAQLTLLFLSSSVVVIGPNEEAILERFGKPVQGKEILTSGLHFKYPWPIDRVFRYPTREVQTIYVGFNPESEVSKSKLILWTVSHYKDEFNMLLASKDVAIGASDSSAEQAVPVNLLSVNIPVQYHVKDIKKWLLQHADSHTLLENIANREVISYLTSKDIDQIMADGRLQAGEDLKAKIQAKAEALGAEIIFVGLDGIHPPVKVADAWEAVIGSLQEKETTVLNATAYAANKLPNSYAEATNIVFLADTHGNTKTNLAYAQAQSFENQCKAWSASPSVYYHRSYLESFANATKNTRKFIIGSTNNTETFLLNLEDRLNKDLFRDLDLNNLDKK